uniref:SCP domain-containing protein n=1 Tax=Lygus hesperus TaxID=30085 RepID=A0A0K8SHI0_LYGHE
MPQNAKFRSWTEFGNVRFFFKPKPTQESFKKWWEESNVAPISIVNHFIDYFRYNHFSQIVWATTHKIGCGEIEYTSRGNNMRYLACNYGPAGNERGQPMYQIGTPCSQCPQGTRCYGNSKFPNLCASVDDLNELFSA